MFFIFSLDVLVYKITELLSLIKDGSVRGDCDHKRVAEGHGSYAEAHFSLDKHKVVTWNALYGVSAFVGESGWLDRARNIWKCESVLFWRFLDNFLDERSWSQQVGIERWSIESVDLPYVPFQDFGSFLD